MIDACGEYFIHSDLGRGLLIAKRMGFKIDPSAIEQSLYNFLAKEIAGDKDRLSFPAFNYDFGTSHVFKPNYDVIQVGRFPEWVRKQGLYRRSHVPFFSVLSNHYTDTLAGEPVRPFGTGSFFEYLTKTKGQIIFFGVDLSSMTFLHYVEELAGKPVYRYDKIFSGTIATGKDHKLCKVIMHVRPKDCPLHYDWSHITRALGQAGILTSIGGDPYFLKLDAKNAMDFLGDKIHKNPFYLLTPESSKHFRILTENGKERLCLEHFE